MGCIAEPVLPRAKEQSVPLPEVSLTQADVLQAWYCGWGQWEVGVRGCRTLCDSQAFRTPSSLDSEAIAQES